MYSEIVSNIRTRINPIIYLTGEAPVQSFRNAAVSPRFFNTTPASLPGRAVQKIPRKNYHDLGRLVPINWL